MPLLDRSTNILSSSTTNVFFLDSFILRYDAASLDDIPKDIAIYSFETNEPRLHLLEIQVPTQHLTKVKVKFSL